MCLHAVKRQLLKFFSKNKNLRKNRKINQNAANTFG